MPKKTLTFAFAFGKIINLFEILVNTSTEKLRFITSFHGTLYDQSSTTTNKDRTSAGATSSSTPRNTFDFVA